MSWSWFSRSPAETTVKVISDLSGMLTVSVDGPEVSAALSALEAALSQVVDVASPVTPSTSSVMPVLSRLRPCVPHVACVPVALVACLPWRPFFRSSVTVASPEPVAVALPEPEPVAVALPESEPVADSLQIRSTVPADTVKDPEAVKEPVSSVVPLQAKTTQASSEELPKTQ